MAKEKFPATRAVRALREQGADFTLRQYKFAEKGGTEAAARELGLDEHLVVKTLVMEDELGNPFLVLMHGDRQVSTKALARVLYIIQIMSISLSLESGLMVSSKSKVRVKMERKCDLIRKPHRQLIVLLEPIKSSRSSGRTSFSHFS